MRSAGQAPVPNWDMGFVPRTPSGATAAAGTTLRTELDSMLAAPWGIRVTSMAAVGRS